MNDFTYYAPTRVILGNGKVNEIGNILAADGVKKVLVVSYGPEMAPYLQPTVDKIEGVLKEAGIEVFELFGIKPNPLLVPAQNGIRICRENNIDAVLAVGGGSVIDTAKCVSAGVPYDGDVWDFWEKKAVIKESIPLYVACTISGTGSENNGNSVIVNAELGKKFLLTSDYLYPKTAIIDPTLQEGIPTKQFVYNVCDACAHVMEHYFDGADSMETSDQIAEALMRTLIKEAPKVVANPRDHEARANFIWCAALALNGTPGLCGMGGNGGDWGPHGLDKGLAINHDTTHGMGLAILYPAWMKYVYKSDLPKFARFAENVFGITEGTQEEKAVAGIKALEDFYAQLGAPHSLKEVGITREDLGPIIKTICLLAPLSKGIQPLYEEDIAKIIDIAYE